MFQHVPFLKTIWSQGDWSWKRLTWNILYNDNVETVFAINYGAQFSKENSSSQNGSISIGGSYSKIAFLGLRKGDPPLNHSFVPKNGGTTIWEKNRGIPSLLFQQGRIFVKVMVLVLIKEKSPSGISIHPGDFLEETPFSRWIGGQRAVNMEHLAPNSFLSDEARRIWKPKT